jgi:hypothetical protein
MKQITFALGALLVLGSSLPAAAQQQPVPLGSKPADPAQSIEQVIDSSGIVPAVEVIAQSATPELERALGQLAQSLSVIAARIAADPELRASAARAGAGMATVAEAVITEQSGALQEALRDLADRLEELSRR